MVKVGGDDSQAPLHRALGKEAKPHENGPRTGSSPLSTEIHIREGQILTGPLFSEPMQVETVRRNGPGVWVLGLVGQRSEQFRRVTLTSDDISNLTIADSALSYDGDGRLLRLALQAYSLGIAYESDPYFGLFHLARGPATPPA